MGNDSAIVWFRRDLRLVDNPALSVAIARGLSVTPLYIWDADADGAFGPGAASRWWLHHSLTALRTELGRAGGNLVLRRGGSLSVLREVVRESGARTVFWNRIYEPAAAARDATIADALRREGCTVETFNSSLLFEPDDVRTKAGAPFQVFTPYYKWVMALNSPGEPLEAPRTLKSGPRLTTLQVSELDLLPRVRWDSGLSDTWTPGAAGAAERLREFVASGMRAYRHDRDFPAIRGTSRLSPHLHFGEISPRQVWHALPEADGRSSRGRLGGPEESGPECYRRELIWREFAHHVLHHFPHTAEQPLRSEFSAFPWRDHGGALRAWQRGRTGYPIVDAGMRELWATGWMHNRVRMIAASFLVKHLLIDWRAGARWFWDTLVDADLANNTMGWQWSSGCGADAAPYFRIFNPTLQGEKFDPDGVYVHRWVPELALLQPPWVHRPWEAPPAALAAAGVRLGTTYPLPIVDHAAARKRALEALDQVKRGRTVGQ